MADIPERAQVFPPSSSTLQRMLANIVSPVAADDQE
jgi:hypothetical protein